MRFVVVNGEELSKQSMFLPAYTVTDFYDLQPGKVEDSRFELPESYSRGSMAELMGSEG